MDPWAPPKRLVEIAETRAAELGCELEWVHNGLTGVGRKLIVLNPEEPPPLDRVEVALDEKGSWWVAAQSVGLCDFLPEDRPREPTVPRDEERRAVIGDLFGFDRTAPPRAEWPHPQDNASSFPAPDPGDIVRVNGVQYQYLGSDQGMDANGTTWNLRAIAEGGQ